MPDFVPHVLDLAACRREIQRLQRLLNGSDDIGEASFRKLLEPCSHLRALIGHYNPDWHLPDCLAWEYPLFGAFPYDFAIGYSARGAYTFLECEDARPNSLFVKQDKRLERAWSSRFGSGYGQIIN